MRVGHSLDELRAAVKPVVLAAGVFDGVHRGHRAVLQTALDDAAARGGEAWVLTFDPHPLRILQPSMAPPSLTSTPHKLALLEAAGLHGTILQPFGRELAGLEPEAFIDRLLASVPTLAGIAVGYNWTFGHRARGNTAMLRAIAAARGFTAHIVEGLQVGGEAISSTRIRIAVQSGRLDEAAGLLGRPFSVFGKVVQGKRYGRQIGFPTANVMPENEVRPPLGSYAVRVRRGGQWWDGAAYVGDPARGFAAVEANVFDDAPDFYGSELEIFFIAHLRRDQAFATEQALQEQIAADVRQARTVLAARPRYAG